jgi:hypothetical protein
MYWALCDINSIFVYAEIIIICEAYYTKGPMGHPVAVTEGINVKKSAFFPLGFIPCYMR